MLKALMTKVGSYLAKKADKMVDFALQVLVIVGLATLGFFWVAPDTARELIFNQNLTIDLQEVQVNVSFGEELTNLLKEIRDGLK